jgi:hypothetical protein
MVNEIPTTLKMKFSRLKTVRESTNWRTPAQKIDVNGDFVQKNVLHPGSREKRAGSDQDLMKNKALRRVFKA